MLKPYARHRGLDDKKRQNTWRPRKSRSKKKNVQKLPRLKLLCLLSRVPRGMESERLEWEGTSQIVIDPLQS